jgi:hypothetical protein
MSADEKPEAARSAAFIAWLLQQKRPKGTPPAGGGGGKGEGEVGPPIGGGDLPEAPPR